MINLYLDVDGVINAVPGRPGLGGWDRGTFGRFEATPNEGLDGYTISYHREMIEALKVITDDPRVRPRWLTTWDRAAPTEIGARIGLGSDWPVVERPLGKWGALRSDFNSEPVSGILWFDDDAWDPTGVDPKLSGLPDVPFLRITPSTNVGISTEQMRMARDFLELVEE